MKTILAGILCGIGLSSVSEAIKLRGSGLHNQSEALTLRQQSQDLNQQIQAYVGSLEPGPTRDFLYTLRLCAPCQTLERFGEPHDGGYVMCTDGLDQGLLGAYSYGINGFDGWGMQVASTYHIPLNEYDCTNANEPAVCAGCKVNFHYECVLNHEAAPKYGFKTMSAQLQDAGHGYSADRSLLLKIDVEAAEWKVFAEEPASTLRKFKEIVVEYHWLKETHNHPLYLKAVKKIEEAGFAVAHLHGNNYGGGSAYFGQYRIPNVLEVTYIPRPANGCSQNVPYRTPQDTPNNPGLPEVEDAYLPSQPHGTASFANASTAPSSDGHDFH